MGKSLGAKGAYGTCQIDINKEDLQHMITPRISNWSQVAADLNSSRITNSTQLDVKMSSKKGQSAEVTISPLYMPQHSAAAITFFVSLTIWRKEAEAELVKGRQKGDRRRPNGHLLPKQSCQNGHETAVFSRDLHGLRNRGLGQQSKTFYTKMWVKFS